MKKALIAYYSKTGNTKKIAQILAKKINADTDEIIDKKDRSGIVGWLVGGKDAFAKKPTEIDFKKNPKKYDLLILGSPIWAWTVAPALRAYLLKNKIRKFAFFCTCGGNNSNLAEKIGAISNKPIEMLIIKDKELDSKETEKKINQFVHKIKEEK
jgi:flavodoxin